MFKITEAILRPFQDVRKFILGSILFSPFFLYIPALGYILWCLKLSYKGKNELPNWEWRVIWHGIKGLFTMVVFLLPFYLVIGVLGFIYGFSSPAFLEEVIVNPQVIFSSTDGMLFAFGVLLFGAFMNLISSSVMSVFALEEKVGKSLSFRRVFKLAFAKPFFLTWLALFVTVDFLYFIANQTAPEFTFLSFLLWGLAFGVLSWILLVIEVSLYGQAVKEAKYRIGK